MKSYVINLFVVMWLLTPLSAGTFSSEYDSNTYAITEGSVDYTFSVPTRNGVQLPAIRGVVIHNPGVNNSTAYQVNERWAAWLYDNGFAFIGNNSAYSAGSFGALSSLAAMDLGGTTYPELAQVPVCVYGYSAGGTATMSLVYNHPERVIAFVVEHTRFLSDVDEASDPAAVKAVPGYFRWGEWDHSRFEWGYQTAGGGAVSVEAPKSANDAIHSMIVRGAQWMAAMEYRQVHASQRYATEEAMGFFGIMLPLRVDYQQGVAGKDPKLGAVTLTPIAREAGVLGEHRFGEIQSEVAFDLLGQLDPAGTRYPNFLKDWDSRDPYYAPYAEFTRINKEEGHSWMANADVAAFWATKFSQGHQDLSVHFLDLLDDAMGNETAIINKSIFPNRFNHAQTIRVSVDPADFPNTTRVEFYANSELKGTLDQAPFDFTYTFDAGDIGMKALYPVAVKANGDRTVGPRRMVQITSNTVGANTAPVVSAIGTVSGNPGQSLSVPFSVSDPDGDDLTVLWREVNRAGITSGSYTATLSGSGANRNLELNLPATPGIVWGVVQVSDGDITTNSYVTLRVRGDGSSAPFFVGLEAIGSDGLSGGEVPIGGWSRRMSVRIHDYDTDVEALTLTASSDNLTTIPLENIRVGGAGEFRYVQVKTLGVANITLTLSDGTTDVVSGNLGIGEKTQANTPPILSAIPDQTASYSNLSDPVEVRVYDLHTASEPLQVGETPLALTVTSGNTSLIPTSAITVSAVGERREIRYTPAYNQTGTATLTATVTDEEGLTASTTFDVTVSAPVALAVPDATLESATISQPYNGTLVASGGIQPYTWSLVSGALPDGISLNANGTLSGTPTETGTFNVTVQAEDSDPAGAVTAQGLFEITVDAFVPVPSGFSATSNANTTVTLAWNDDAVGETGYTIERKPESSSVWSPLTTTAADATSYIDSDSLIAGTRYEYRIQAAAPIPGLFSEKVVTEALAAPAITSQPADSIVLSSNTATLEVTATGGVLSYQWYEGSAGDVSNPVAGATSASLDVPNVTELRTFWVRVTNSVGQIDSVAASVNVDESAPSLKVNLGADAGAGWNSYVSYAEFNGNTTLSDDSLVYTNDSPAGGVTLTITRHDSNEPFYDHFNAIPLPAYSGDWLNDTAATSAWGVGLGYDMKYEVSGLPAGTYQVEAYVYLTSSTASANDGTTYPAYKLDTNQLLAGISGSTAGTTAEYNSSGFDAEDHPTQVLRWTEVQVAEGETIEIFSTSSAATQEYPVLNAFVIKGVSLNLPRPVLNTPPQNVQIAEGLTTTLNVSATSSGGSLSYQWYRGVSGDTTSPVGADSDSFTTPTLNETTGYWVRVSDDNGSTDSDTAVVTVQQSATAERILFVGNSFTNGYVDPAQTYNTANVTDLNGSGYGGVPGIFAKIASDSGYPVEVGIESVNGSTLIGRYPQKVNLITNPAWDRYVLQSRSQEAMLDGRGDGASASVFNTTVGDWQTAILNANAQAKVWLYAAWASPTYVGENPDDYYSTAEGTETFLNEINTANYQGFTTLGLDGWVPVGQAFSDAADSGLTDLYHIDDHHANAAGSYLAAVMMYRQLLGGDPRLLPTGPGSAPSDLGLTAFQTETIHQLAYAFEFSTVQPLPPSISSQPDDTSILTGETAGLSVVAVGESLTYQWYEGVSGNTSLPVAGATSNSLTTPVMNTEGTVDFWVRISNANGTVDSQSATVTVTAPNQTPATSWEAYHNTEALVANPNESLVSKGNTADTAYHLVKYADGTAADGATITMSYTQTWTMNGSRAGAVMPDAGTDAHTLFDGKLALNGRTSFVSATNSPTAVIRFDNLDPESTYAVRMTLNRGADFEDTQFELIDATSSTAASSSGIQVISATQVAMNSLNTSNGYVAGWDAIVPSGSSGTSFAVRIVPGPQQDYIYLPQLIRIGATSPMGPSINSEPADVTINNGESTTLSVSATAGAGGLHYQWYEGQSGTTDTPVGADNSNFTTPALLDSTAYWVLVTDEFGSVHSATATVTVNPVFEAETTRLYLDTNGTALDPGVSNAEDVVWDIGSEIWSPEAYAGQEVNLDHDFTASTLAWIDGSRVALTGGAPAAEPVTLRLAQNVNVRGIDYYSAGDYRLRNNGGDPVTLTLLEGPVFDPGEYATIYLGDGLQLLGDFRFRENRGGTLVLESTASPLPYVGTVTLYQGALVAETNRTSVDTHVAFAPGSHTSSFELGAASVEIGSLSGQGAEGADTVRPRSDAPVLTTLIINQSSDTTYSGNMTDSTVGGKQLALQKTGTGTLSLTGITTHSGGTTVSEGTLHVSGGIGGGDVIIQAGGTLLLRKGPAGSSVGSGATLTFESDSTLAVDLAAVNGDDTSSFINGSLAIGNTVTLRVSEGGAAPANGTYDLLSVYGSMSGQFAEVVVAGGKTGTLGINGTMLQLTVTDTFSSWAAHNTVSADPAADPDNDGVVNLMEYALRLNPNLNQGTGMPTGGAVEEGGQLYQTFRYRRNLEATDLTYVIEGADVLGDPSAWQPFTIDPADETVVDPDVDGDGKVELVEVKVNVNGKTRHFLRLEAVR